VTLLRFGIVYGPRRENWSAVEALTDAVARNDVVKVGSRATARRFIHVRDIAGGILAATGRSGCEVFNIQGPKLVSLGDVIEAAGRVLGRRPRIEETAPGSPSLRPVASTRSEQALGWKAAIGIEEGIRDVADFLGLVRS
jgi:nucleoside-diphosphate-sugar epimerase